MGEILEDNAAALEELLELANEEELGNPPLTIDGDEFLAVVNELAYDEIQAAGGTGEGGGFTAIARISSFAEGPPEKLAEITARGMSLSILEVKRSTAHYIITAGDPVADE